MIQRTAEKELQSLARDFRAAVVVGPRQSGKTTLIRKVFHEKTYVSLENPDMRQYATEDPRGFLSNYPQGAILDEIQRVPTLFSYLQQILDETSERGLFILSGSNNFLLQENISQSLAGRVGYLYLLPLSINEINEPDTKADELIFKGGYPALYAENLNISRFYANYIRTYVERDVRLIKNIGNLYTFERFLKLCAGRIGQLLNMSALSVEVGVDSKTIDSWLSVLEASFIVFRLQPYHKNYNKRIVKMPKLYFYDVGLACALLGIENPEQLALHPFRGALFENLIISDMLKKRFNEGKSNNLFFWRDSTGLEIDLLLEKSDKLIPIEMKSGQTVIPNYFTNIAKWMQLSDTKTGFVVYAGNTVQKRSNGISVFPYFDAWKIE